MKCKDFQTSFSPQKMWHRSLGMKKAWEIIETIIATNKARSSKAEDSDSDLSELFDFHDNCQKWQRNRGRAQLIKWWWWQWHRKLQNPDCYQWQGHFTPCRTWFQKWVVQKSLSLSNTNKFHDLIKFTKTAQFTTTRGILAFYWLFTDQETVKVI